MELYLRDQQTILADVKARVRDTSNARWSDLEIYRTLNDALSTWHGRVSIPMVYNVSGGWVPGTYEYTLPAYVTSGTVVPQFKRTVPYAYWNNVALDDDQTWTDIPGWTIEPNGSGGQVLRFDVSPYSAEGRLLWWANNGPVPTVLPTTSGETTAAATSMVLGSAVDCVDSGFVKVNSEWIQYAGVTRTTSTTTLGGLLRAYSGGIAAAIHATTSSVSWGVAMPRLELYRTLLDQMMVFLHELYLADAAPRETQIHQQMVSFYQARIDKFWRAWIPQRKMRVIIDRRYSTIE
jgi:hypothetical protein